MPITGDWRLEEVGQGAAGGQEFVEGKFGRAVEVGEEAADVVGVAAATLVEQVGVEAGGEEGV